MADIRINSLPSTATSFNSDDYIAIDGTSGGTRKMLAANPPFNDVILGSSGPSVKSTLSARAPRQGLVFDGTAGTTVANVPAFGTGDFAVAAWINPTLSANAVLFGAAANAAYLQVRSNGTVDWYSNSVRTYTGTGAVVASKNQLVVVARTAGAVAIYINGVAASVTSPTDTENIAQAITAIGKLATGGNEYSGNILSPLIYNRALSSSEVVALYEAGAPAGADYNNAGSTDIKPSAGTYAYWFGTGSISSATASSFTIDAGANNLNVRNAAGTFALVSGHKYRMTIVASGLSATSGVGAQVVSTTFVSNNITNGTNIVEFTANGTGNCYFNFELYSTAGGSISISSIQALGLLLAPDAYEAGGGLSWYDTSGNSATITLPASGVSWNVPSSQKTASGWSFGGDVTFPTSKGIYSAVTNGRLFLSGDSGGNGAFIQLTGSAYSTPNHIRIDSSTGTISNLANTKNSTWDVDQNWSLAGNLTVSGGTCILGSSTSVLYFGTPSSNYQYFDGTDLFWRVGGTDRMVIKNGGNLLLGTVVNSTGLLQIGTNTTTAAGGIGFGTDTSLFRVSAGKLAGPSSLIDVTYASTGIFFGASLTLGANDNIYLKTNGATTALTLDSSQNATFAGAVTAGGNVNLAVGKLLTLNGNATAGSYALQAATASSPYDFRIIGASDSGTQRYFSFGHYTGDNIANAWNERVNINSYNGNATFTGAIAIGNTVNTVSPTSPNRTITMVIGGTTYYIAAKTTND